MYISTVRRGVENRRRTATHLHITRPDDEFSKLPARKLSFRGRVWTLMDDPNSSRPAKYISMFIMLIIALSVVNFIVGTEVTPRCAWVSLGSAPDEVAYECGESRLSESGVSADVLHTLETVCIMVFTVEYVLRILTCTTAMPLGRFLRAPMNVIGSADTLGLGLGFRV